MESKDAVEQTVKEALERGDMLQVDPKRSAVDRLSPRYEIRVKAAKDPIVEETKVYRSMAEEADERYDAYLAAIPKDPDRNPRA